MLMLRDRNGVSFIAGMVFLIAGAWPVIGFFGLDVALIYWAFRVNYRAARAYEQVSVTPSELSVRKVSRAAQSQGMDVQSALGAARPRSPSGIRRQRLYLVSRGQRLAIAGFLGPQEKESFATALFGGLGEARRGPTGPSAVIRNRVGSPPGSRPR